MGAGAAGGVVAQYNAMQNQPAPFAFDLSELEAFRYRVEDVKRGVTKGEVGRECVGMGSFPAFCFCLSCLVCLVWSIWSGLSCLVCLVCLSMCLSILSGLSVY